MIRLAPVSTVLASNLGIMAPPVIEAHDTSQRDYWSYRLRVSQNELSAAIAEVGTSLAAVRRHLGK
ncbi:MAG TPA: DUF3606 domain-containing protein [Tardiphaga sp.]